MPIIPDNEITIEFVRSSGPGGQNVNKVNTKAQLRWSIGDSVVFTPVEKERIRQKLKRKITKDDEVIVMSDVERSQEQNRARAIELLQQQVAAALIIPKKRIPTRPTHASKVRRVESKVQRSAAKRMRSGKELD